MPDTADTAPGAARSLLDCLTDDQLARYGEIARDQAAAELSRWWLQVLFAVAAVGAFAWALSTWGVARIEGLEALGVEAEGFGRSVAFAFGLGLLLAYFPYRRVKNWLLWNAHCKAVAAEQSRRRNVNSDLPGRNAQPDAQQGGR
jgi:hypothetical protein